jgi:type VI secretion system protein ImpH
MASETRHTASALALFESLAASPYEVSYFEALRRVDCAHPDRPRTGRAARPRDEALRLGQEPSLAFAPSTLASFDTATEDHPPRLDVFFFGLLGPNGPLPLHITEYVRDRSRNSRDPTLERFLDLFHHRMLALFYRAWASAQPTVSLDRPSSDRFGDYVGSLLGIGMPAMQNRDAMPDLAKRHYAGHLACQSRHADGLRAMLADFFKLPVRLDECVGQWLRLPEESQCRLGESPQTGTLGINAVAGAEVWETQVKFRIVFGPVDLAHYRRLLPGGDSLQRLVDMVRSYAGDQLDWELQIVLRADAVPPPRLGEGGQLGWSTWLASEPFVHDADDLHINPLEHAARRSAPEPESPSPPPPLDTHAAPDTFEESVHG